MTTDILCTCFSAVLCRLVDALAVFCLCVLRLSGRRVYMHIHTYTFRFVSASIIPSHAAFGGQTLRLSHTILNFPFFQLNLGWGISSELTVRCKAKLLHKSVYIHMRVKVLVVSRLFWSRYLPSLLIVANYTGKVFVDRSVQPHSIGTLKSCSSRLVSIKYYHLNGV